MGDDSAILEVFTTLECSSGLVPVQLLWRGTMKNQILALAVVIAIFSGISRADSCAAGSFSSLLGTSCMIGDKTFTFNAGNSDGDPSILPALIFTPESTPTSAGFNISGFPGASSAVDQPNARYFIDFFTAVPSSGTITSFTATLNGVSQDDPNDSTQESSAFLNDPSFAEDQYFSSGGTTNHTQFVGGSEPTFGAGGFGYFELKNSSANGGSTSFTSADFVFNESTTTTVPEGSELAMLGISALGMLGGALRKKLHVA